MKLFHSSAKQLSDIKENFFTRSSTLMLKKTASFFVDFKFQLLKDPTQ